MRLGILCGSSPRACFVANALCERLNVCCIISEVGREWSWRKVRRNLSPSVLSAKAYRRVQPWLFPPDADAARFLFPDGRPRFEAGQLVSRTAHINAPAVAETLRRQRVDFIAVFGTSLIRRPELFSLAPGRLLNLHGGLSPWYRGADSTFWALYNSQIEKIGCTIHFIDRAIDSGRLIAHVCPPVRDGDRESRLFLNSIRSAAPVYAEAIRRIDDGEHLGAPQPGGGRLYLHRHRRYRHDRRVRRMFAVGCFRGVELPARIRWFRSDGDAAQLISATDEAIGRGGGSASLRVLQPR